MFKKSRPLQSKSEIILRNIVVLAMVVFFIVFLIIPIGIAFAGSFHEWNPLSGTYKFLGLENYKQVFTSKLFGKSMFNTVIFSVVVIVFRVGLGLGIAYAIYSTLIKHKSFFRAVYYMPVVTPMVAVAFVWKFMYNPQIGIINKIFGLDINWLMNPKTALIAVIIMTIWKDLDMRLSCIWQACTHFRQMSWRQHRLTERVAGRNSDTLHCRCLSL